MDEQNKRILDHLGVTAWHEAGYTGKHGLSATAEKETTPHGSKTRGVFKVLAPDRELIHIPFDIEGLRSIKSYPRKIDTMFASLSPSSFDSKEVDDALQAVANHLTFFASAGNYSTERASRFIEADLVYGIGAYILMTGNRINPASYTSHSIHVDFTGPIYINNFTGTSASTPVICGMAALVNDMAIQRYGKPLSSYAMYEFMKDHSIDIWDKGKDNQTGWGAPVLPNPDKANLEFYLEVDEMIFSDDGMISPWAKDAVYNLVEKGILNGKNEGFDPKGNLTREEAAVVIQRLINYLEKN